MLGESRNTFHRRGFLDFSVTGLGAAALFGLLDQGRTTGAEKKKGSSPHPPAKAKRAIHICLIGGLSQVDSFDYKP